MIAIGFLWILVGLFGCAIAENYISTPIWLEKLSAALLVFGFVMVIAGLTVLMWRHLP